MNTQVVPRWVRRAAVVLTALAAAIVFLPTAARASCGDYVVIGNPQHAAAGHPQMDHPEQPRSDPPANRPAPCHGLRCSGGPPVSPLQPAPPTNVRGDDCGLVSAFLDAADNFSSTYRSDDCLIVPTGPRPTVYHPPR